MKRKYLSFEKHICVCGKTMKYDGIETVSIRNELDDDETVEDLDVYICPKCDYKIWLIAPSYSKHLELLKKLRKVVRNVFKKYLNSTKKEVSCESLKEQTM